MLECRQRHSDDREYPKRYIGRSQLAFVCIANPGVAEVGERPKRHPKDKNGSDKSHASRDAKHIDMSEDMNNGRQL